MKKIILLLCVIMAVGFLNTVESVVPGGLGRSKMIVTNPDGSQKEADLENLFSITSINFKNIKENEDKIMKTRY